MNIKNLIQKLNNQKGLTGADIMISMLIILTAVGVIATVYVNINFSSKQADRKAKATMIATNIIENMSAYYYDEITQILNNHDISDNEGNIITNRIFDTDIFPGYSVNIKLQNYENVVHEATVTVKYTINDIEQNVTLKKAIEREIVKECNEPNFLDEEYQIQLKKSSGDTFLQYDNTSETAIGEKIICPLKYNKSTHKYEIIKDTQQDWYSYSNKQWARILVIPAEDLTKYETNGIINDNSILTKNFSYVWIPRFGIKSGSVGNLNIFFKYKDSNTEIVNDTSFYVNFENTPSEASSMNYDFLYGSKELYGKWCPYSEINSYSVSVAYYLNNSQYGPLLEY